MPVDNISKVSPSEKHTCLYALRRHIEKLGTLDKSIIRLGVGLHIFKICPRVHYGWRRCFKVTVQTCSRCWDQQPCQACPD